MAEDQDESSKTEEPTEKKLSEAREKGNVPRSQEVNHLFALAGALAVLAVILPAVVPGLTRDLAAYLEHAHAVSMDAGGAVALFRQLIRDLALVLAIPLAVMMVAGIVASYVQMGWLWSTEQLKFDLDKLNPITGFKRMVSLRSVVEFLKGIAKLLVAGLIPALLFIPIFEGAEGYAGMPLAAMLDLITQTAVKMVAAVVAVMLLIALADFAYQRFDYMKRMRMTRQEVKDEFKQQEGDPIIKGRIRTLRMQRARQRMMAAVPKATVVVTNPTHYAVAMRYVPSEMPAPVVVAKGTDALAQRIRAIAEEHEVPIVENPPLARALHRAVEVDQEIPPEHYRAVAEVISYVFRLKGGVA